MEKIASPFVRNSANVGRNLVMAQKNSFPSDISTLFLELYATISLMTNHGIEKFTWEELLSRPHLDLRIVLLSICKTVKKDQSSVQTHSRFFYVFEFLNALTGVHSSISGDLLDGINDISAEEVSESSNNGCISQGSKQTPLSSTKQVVKSSTKYYPVGESIKKVELPCKLLVVENSTLATFLRVVGSELIQKYLGDGPKLVRELFRVANDLSPSIVFIDEIGAVGTKRVVSGIINLKIGILWISVN
ncbi:hypothetical protein T459_14593 [Capsicum annuum]|uniref:ATPase AAA-type core domain-containing protein n=1 Tax=Capsicum annuum TaxID=4072 RepID=A0A2G2ZHV6_CAPAN|nr:hypothetical protein T459_14593 [Capsicum annuum]